MICKNVGSGSFVNAVILFNVQTHFMCDIPKNFTKVSIFYTYMHTQLRSIAFIACTHTAAYIYIV